MSNSLIIRPKAELSPAEVLEEMAINPEPRFPYIVVADRSGSMYGQPIEEVNRGFVDFTEDVQSCPVTQKRAEIAVVSFGGDIRLDSDFCLPPAFEPPVLTAGGGTPLAEAVHVALDIILGRLELYDAASLDRFKPTIFLFSDGKVRLITDLFESAATRIQQQEAAKQLAFFAVATQDAAAETLQKLSVRTVVKLRNADFQGMFQDMARSVRTVSTSRVGEEPELPNPCRPGGWGTL
jgi:uncharacterized protein YegL